MSQTTTTSSTFTVPEGYDLAGTEFQISDIKVNDHPDGSGAGVLIYDLTHEEDVDSDKLIKVVNELILTALNKMVEESKNDAS